MNIVGGVLEQEERAFFTRIKQAIITNPFSSDRTTIDLKLAGLASGSSKDEVFGKLNRRVSRTLEMVRKRAQKSRLGPGDGDLELLRYGALFQIFYQFSEHYDQLIQVQISKGDESCPADFAGEVLKRLAEAGFTRDESLRYFALFFQMRRAFFFIQAIAGKSSCVGE